MLEHLISLLNSFDIYYAYSDDNSVWKTHSEIRSKISKLLKRDSWTEDELKAIQAHPKYSYFKPAVKS